MKINKKLLIPVFATAMGLSVIGGVSGAVAWYQYNTKAEASWVGASVADGGSLLISEDGSQWERSIVFDASNTSKTLHPVTFPGFDGSGTPSGAKKHPEYGQVDTDEWADAVEGTDYYQYTFYLKAMKIVNNEYKSVAMDVKIKEFILTTVESTKTDAAKAIRANFATSSVSKTYALVGGSTTCSGSLDLNGDEQADYQAGYAWTDGFKDPLTYGDGNPNYSSTELAADVEFLTVPADGVEITLTLWMEGWHSYASGDMSMWEPQNTGGATIRFGVTFGVEKSDLGIE